MPASSGRRVAAVTGGGTGIGFAIAKELALQGFEVAICGRRGEILEEAASEIAIATDSRIIWTSADLAEPAAPEEFVRFVVGEFGQVDVLVNNACSFYATDFLELDAGKWDGIANAGLRGVALCSASAARRMRDSGGGRIILMSSMDAIVSEPNVAHYNSVKAGVSSLARSMAYDLSKHGITVNAVAPGWIKTPGADWALAEVDAAAMLRVNPVGRWGEPGEVANLVAYLATTAPTFMTGSTITIDGGQTAVAVMP